MARARLSRARALLVSLAAALAFTSLSACTSPTLPLPPPASPLIATGLTPDTFRLTSVDGSEPNAVIVIVNRNESLPRDKRVSGTIADERGSWEATVIARVGDVLDISQEASGIRSPATSVTVR